MAYRKTALVHAKSQAMRGAIILATIDLVARAGLDKLSTDAIAKRAGVAAGSIYTHFADKTELLAAATAQILAADISAMREAETGDLAPSLLALYGRFESPHLTRAMIDAPAYREGIRDELAGVLKSAVDMPAKSRKTAAAVILAILHAVYELLGPGTMAAEIAATYALRAVGVSNAQIARAIERA